MTTYISVELDAINKAPNVGRAAGVSEDTILAGLNRLWAYCFREKKDVLDALEVAGCFTSGINLFPALVSFGFLEPKGDAYRVKGADKYLRIANGRSEGGKKAVKKLNASRWGADTKPIPSRSSPSAEYRLDIGLSPNTEHRAPSTLTTTTSPPAAAGWQNLVEQLFQKFVEIRNTKPRFSDADFAQLKRLRKENPDEEILARWARGLRGTYARQVNSLADLAKSSKWNALATDEPGQATNPTGWRTTGELTGREEQF